MRTTQRASVDHTLDAVRTGRSTALVVRAEPGIDRRAELDRVTHAKAGSRPAWIAGAPCDQDIPYSGLHQVCAQLLDQVERLTWAQRDVLRAAFDPDAPAPDPRSVGLVVFSLLAHAAEERPVLCVVDNAHWLDQSSRRALAVTARRLVAESVALLFVVGADEEMPELAGLPEATHARGLPRAVQAHVVPEVQAPRLPEAVQARRLPEAVQVIGPADVGQGSFNAG